MSVCPRCALSNPPGARFCGGCGADIQTPVVEEVAAPSIASAALVVPLESGRRSRRRPATRSTPRRRNPTARQAAEQRAPVSDNRGPRWEEPASAAVASSALGSDPLRDDDEIAERADVPSEGVAVHRRAEDEPARGLQILMMVTGTVLLGLFCSPWQLVGNGSFSWDVLEHLAPQAFAQRLFLPAAGLVLLAAALLPLPRRLRASIACALGLLHLVLRLPNLPPRDALLAVLLVIVPAALLLRGRSSASRLARGVVAAGVCGLLALLLIPHQKLGGPPLFAGFGAPPTASFALVLARLLPLALAAVALLALLAFLPRTSSGGVQIWATLLLLYLPAMSWLRALPRLDAGGTSLAGLYLGLATLVCGANAALGLSHLLPRRLDATARRSC